MKRIMVALALVTSIVAIPVQGVAQGGGGKCDFDGDGHDDVPIGVPFEDVDVIGSAGAVNVIYGSADGLTDAGDQLWHQDTPGVLNAAEPDDVFGRAVECGDFDNDGYDDLVIGAPGEDVSGVVDAGAIHVLFGSSEGLIAAGDLFLHRNSSGVNGSAGSGDFFGRSLAVGDFNDDGRDDLAVGVPFDHVSGVSDAGSVHVFYGNASGLSTSNDEIWHRGTTGINGPLQTSGNFGRALAAGDFDGDGYHDLVAGAPFDGVSGVGQAGSVSVIYGSASGLTQAGDDYIHRDSSGIKGSPDWLDRFGFAVAAGDFDGDGYDELAVGVPQDDIGGEIYAGSVHVINGSSTGLTEADEIWHRNSDGIRGSAAAGDLFGWSLTTGRFDSGNKEDLAIGVPKDDPQGFEDTGSVHVLYGSSNGLTKVGDEVWHQGVDGIRGNNEDGDQFGYSLSRGDFDDNGKARSGDRRSHSRTGPRPPTLARRRSSMAATVVSPTRVIRVGTRRRRVSKGHPKTSTTWVIRSTGTAPSGRSGNNPHHPVS